MRTFNFIACLEDGIPVAICLEHDLVTHAETIGEIRGECENMLRFVAVVCHEEGLDPWDSTPPPEEAVQEFRDMPGSFTFSLTLDV